MSEAFTRKTTFTRAAGALWLLSVTRSGFVGQSAHCGRAHLAILDLLARDAGIQRRAAL